jgi:hypothetical protein
MRASKVVTASLALAAIACSISTSSPTPTSAPTPTPLPSSTATATAAPTLTSTATTPPTSTFEPAPDLDGGILETALRAEGYRRYPFAGEDGFYWDNGSGIVFYTYPEGFEMGFLNDARDLPGRLELIEQAIDIVAPHFAPGFVEGLLGEVHTYAGRVGAPSGEAVILDFGQEPWLGQLMEYNGYETWVRNGPSELFVYFRLLYREYLCDMTLYSYCYFIDMPSMTYTEAASLTTFNIWIDYP